MPHKIIIDGCNAAGDTEKAVKLALHNQNDAEVVVIQGAQGAAKPIISAGKDLTWSRAEQPEQGKDGYAWDILYKEASSSEKKVTVVTLGTVTDLAIALFRYEDLKQYVEKIIMLGGSAEAGNLLPFGEANVARDAYACQTVLQSGIPVWMIGLDAAERSGVEFDGSLAVAAALCQEIAQGKEYYVRVDTAPGEMYGRTIADIRLHSKEEKNVRVIEKIEKELYEKLMKEA